jgi:hypothetical protein
MSNILDTNGVEVAFQEKSSIVMTAILALVFGIYFAMVISRLADTPADEIVYQPLLIVAIVPLVVLAVVSHIVLALTNLKQANDHDERDRLISLRGEQCGGYVLAVGVFVGLVLAMAEAPYFFVAHALLAGWVLAEISAGGVRILLYRRGA